MRECTLEGIDVRQIVSQCMLSIGVVVATAGYSMAGSAYHPTLPGRTDVLLIEDAEGLLLADGQKVLFTMTTGPLSEETGSQGKGKFAQTLRAASKTFGPAKVIAHTASSLTFRGKRDTCVMTSDFKVSCKKIGSGTWRIM